MIGVLEQQIDAVRRGVAESVLTTSSGHLAIRQLIQGFHRVNLTALALMETDHFRVFSEVEKHDLVGCPEEALERALSERLRQLYNKLSEVSPDQPEYAQLRAEEQSILARQAELLNASLRPLVNPDALLVRAQNGVSDLSRNVAVIERSLKKRVAVLRVWRVLIRIALFAVGFALAYAADLAFNWNAYLKELLVNSPLLGPQWADVAFAFAVYLFSSLLIDPIEECLDTGLNKEDLLATLSELSKEHEAYLERVGDVAQRLHVDTPCVYALLTRYRDGVAHQGETR